jgi:hypothetical protein
MAGLKGLAMWAGLLLALAPGLGEARDVSESADLVLKVPAAKASTIIDGAEWVCLGTACHAAVVEDMPTVRSCQRVAAVLGAVDSFTWRGRVLTAEELPACNTRARP